MVDDGEYELLPHEELEYLRNEIHKIKRNPIQGYKEADDLKESIDKLNTSINNLITLFSNTNDELVEAFKKTTIEEHFEQLSSQNEQIAQGILAVAKLVEDSTKNSQASLPQSQTPRTVLPDDPSYSTIPNSNSSIPPSMEPPMPARQPQPLSAQAPSFPDDNFNLSDDFSFSDPSMPPSQDLHPLNSQNLGMPNPNVGMGGMDLPPPPEKKKGLLGMFK
jgi:hypothetical protein